MVPLKLTVNGRSVEHLVVPRTHLADHLRDAMDLTGTHLGCEQGACGACTVLVDGVPVRGCLVRAVECDGASVRSIEGFDDDPVMAALRVAFSAHHALQCGYCTPGMLITARDIVLRLGEQPEARVRAELAGNLCRCTGYQGIVAAVMSVAAGRAPQPPETRVAEARAIAPAPVAAQPVTAVSLPAGAAGVTETLAIAAPADAVFAILSDPRRVAACLPGAEITAWDGTRLEGGMRVALGPIKVAFAGSGEASADAATRSGRLTGSGRDGGTGSGAVGSVAWRVVPQGDNCQVEVDITWRLSGALAGFARGGLVRDLVGRMAREFGANLAKLLAGAPVTAAPPPSLFALLFLSLRAWLSARFTRRDGGSP
ncbi:xanthine dehydrogenase family Fe-S subunit [Humitalea sp. 24SJ18S-53]|uniref:xanthine dehydrogenase family Fe-S subunit n=1 Tax=Humitalea sp. 24SJ18S-53 TaxID=3422307 RepID=UPI003D6752D4